MSPITATADDGNGRVEYGALQERVRDHGRRIVTLEGHVSECPIVPDVKDLMAFKNKWAGTLVGLQVISIIIGIVALVFRN